MYDQYLQNRDSVDFKPYIIVSRLVVHCFNGPNFGAFRRLPIDGFLTANCRRFSESTSEAAHRFLVDHGRRLSWEERAMLEAAMAKRAEMEAFRTGAAPPQQPPPRGGT